MVTCANPQVVSGLCSRFIDSAMILPWRPMGYLYWSINPDTEITHKAKYTNLIKRLYQKTRFKPEQLLILPLQLVSGGFP